MVPAPYWLVLSRGSLGASKLEHDRQKGGTGYSKEAPCPIDELKRGQLPYSAAGASRLRRRSRRVGRTSRPASGTAAAAAAKPIARASGERAPSIGLGSPGNSMPASASASSSASVPDLASCWALATASAARSRSFTF